MKTCLKCVLIVVAVFFGLVWGISAYLSVDDLRYCSTTPSAKTGCQAADAVVAISGGDTSARAAEAIRLFQNGWGRVLIFSGAAADKSGPSNAQVMARQAIAAGVNPANIITENASETTTENAAETTNIFKQNGITSAIVVTSAYHERRAMLEFDRRALGVAIRGHPVSTDKQWNRWWWLTPTGWSLAIPETVRSLVLTMDEAR